jgi:hypothetical protein
MFFFQAIFQFFFLFLQICPGPWQLLFPADGV